MSTEKLFEPCVLPEFDLFKLPHMSYQVEKSLQVDYRPLTALKSDCPIEFFITGTEDELVSLHKSKLYLRFNVFYKAVGADKPKSTDWQKLDICQNALHSIFKDVEVNIGDKKINSTFGTYPYIAFLSTLLYKSKEEKNSSCRGAFWFENLTSLTSVISTSRSSALYPRFVTAESALENGRTVEVCGSLETEIFNQKRPIPGQIPIRIKLYPNKPEFYFTTSDSAKFIPKLVLQDAFLSVHKYKITRDMQLALNSAIKLSSLKYPIVRREIKYFTINSTSPSVVIDNAIVGQLPRRCFVVLLDANSFEGSYDTFPFHFGNKDLNKISCLVNGELYPSRPYQPEYSEDIYNHCYLGLLDALKPDCNFNYTYDTYKETFPIYAFDLSCDGATGGDKYINKQRFGSIRFDLNFAKALTKATTLLILSEYDNLLQIDHLGSVATDFN